jgi:hypothetical protein
MTSIKKRKGVPIKKNKDLGSKVRHPSGTVYPKIIFLHEKHDKRDKTKETRVSRLYQDMILYSLSSGYHDMLQKQKEQGEPIGFKIKNIGYWLLHHNPDFIDRYRDSMSKTRESIILSNIRNTIDGYLENLEKWCIVKRLQEVDAETRNGTKTPLYRYGRVGMIIAWILKYRDKSDYDRKQEAKNNIFDLIQRMFKSYNAYKADFLAEFYHKLIEYDDNNNNQLGVCDGVIRQIISAFEDDSITHDKAIDYLDHVLQTILIKPVGDLQTKETILRLYLQTLDEVPEDTRKMTMYQDKHFFENKLSMSLPYKEWSKAWEKNITNYDTIVVCCTCQNKECSHYKHYATVVCDYYSYISAMSLSADSSYSEMDCPVCKTEKSIYVYNTMNNLIDGIMNNSF